MLRDALDESGKRSSNNLALFVVDELMSKSLAKDLFLDSGFLVNDRLQLGDAADAVGHDAGNLFLLLLHR